MNKLTGKFAVLAIALGSVLALAACDVEQTQEGELPEVDVDAAGGELPAYDVETPEIAVEMPDEPNTEVVEEVDSEYDDAPADVVEDEDP